MRLGSIEVPVRVLPLVASTVSDTTAIKTSIQTAVTAQTYSGAALNGSDVATGTATPAPSGLTNVAQYPTVTCSNNAGVFTLNSAVTFTGTYGGKTVIRTATITSTAGNGTYVADGPVNTVTSVTVAAQATTGGTISLGWNDVACPERGSCQEPFRLLRPTSTGNCVVVCASQDAATIPLVSGGPDEIVGITRIKFSDGGTTVTTLNLYE
jgi:hypothetical protein